jgi:hypothetical protein
MYRNSINRNQRDINQSVNDRFELIIKIHRFFGVTNLEDVKNSSTKQKWKSILFILYQIIIYTILIFNQGYVILKFSKSENLNRTQIITSLFFYIIRLLTGILSSILFSIRSKQFVKFISNLRLFTTSLDNNGVKSKYRLKNLRYFIYLFFGYLLFIDIMSVFIYYQYNLLWEIFIDYYSYVYIYSADFYFIYLTNYVIIIQKLFNDDLLRFNSINIKLSDVHYLKSNFLKIQSFITDISSIFSPLLLINCAILTYHLVVSCYFLFNTILTRKYTESYVMLILPLYFITNAFLQLLIICLCAENINKKVSNIHYSYFHE